MLLALLSILFSTFGVKSFFTELILFVSAAYRLTDGGILGLPLPRGSFFAPVIAAPRCQRLRPAACAVLSALYRNKYSRAFCFMFPFFVLVFVLPVLVLCAEAIKKQPWKTAEKNFFDFLRIFLKMPIFPVLIAFFA